MSDIHQPPDGVNPHSHVPRPLQYDGGETGLLALVSCADVWNTPGSSGAGESTSSRG